jgi:hypothetical protein
MRIRTFALAGLVLTCGPFLVHAAPADAPRARPARPAADPALAKAKKAFSQGRSLYLQKKYEQAAASFLAAYDAKPIPAFLFNAAVAFEKAKRYEKALAHFRKYLRKSPKASDAESIKKRIAALRKALEDAKAPPRRRAVEPPPDRRDPGTPPRRRVVEPPPRRRAVVVPVLPKIEPKGVVVISTKPEGANLYLNSKMKPLGQSPWEGTLTTGEHQLIIESKGYKPEKKTISVSPDRIVDVYVALSQEHYLGWVSITANRPGALIYIDDRSVGAVAKTPYNGFLKPGIHKIWVDKAGYQQRRKDVEVVSGKTHKVHFSLKPVDHGWLSVEGSSAYGGEVVLNGKVICKVPCDRAVVQPGKYEVEIRREGYKPVKRELVVHRLRHATARVRLRKKPSLASAYVAYGVAAAFLAGGITLGFLSNNLEKDLRKEIDNQQGLISSMDGRFQRGKLYAYLANGLFGLAGISAIFGIYYTFADRGPKSTMRIHGKKVTLHPAFGPGYAGVTGHLRF